MDPNEQPTLLDLDGEKLNAMWVDEKQPLFLPNNPMHWKAHKLQVLLARLDKQAEKNAAQFNSTTYLKILDEYTRCVKAITEGRENEVLDTQGVDSDGHEAGSAEVGSTVALSVVDGVSADNPLAG